MGSKGAHLHPKSKQFKKHDDEGRNGVRNTQTAPEAGADIRTRARGDGNLRNKDAMTRPKRFQIEETGSKKRRQGATSRSAGAQGGVSYGGWGANRAGQNMPASKGKGAKHVKAPKQGREPCPACNAPDSCAWRRGHTYGQFPGIFICNACWARERHDGAKEVAVVGQAMVPDNPQGRGKGRTRAGARDAAGNELDAADSEALLRGSRQDDAAEALLRGSRQDDEEGLLSFGSDNLMEEDSGCSEDSLGSGGGCYATIHGGSDSEGCTRGQRDGRAFANWGQPGSAKLQTSEDTDRQLDANKASTRQLFTSSSQKRKRCAADISSPDTLPQQRRKVFHLTADCTSAANAAGVTQHVSREQAEQVSVSDQGGHDVGLDDGAAGSANAAASEEELTCSEEEQEAAELLMGLKGDV